MPWRRRLRFHDYEDSVLLRIIQHKAVRLLFSTLWSKINPMLEFVGASRCRIRQDKNAITKTCLLN